MDEDYLEKITDVSDFKRTYRTPKKSDLPDRLTVRLKKESELRYGENPNQPAAEYVLRRTFFDWLFGRKKGVSIAKYTNIRLAKSGKGGLSAINFMDVTRAFEVLKYFDKPAVSVMKHNIPSGFATMYDYDSLANLYRNARDADARSAFGSVVVFNKPVDKDTANALLETYVEGVAAPGYEDGAMGILEQKKDMRVVLFSNLSKVPKFIDDDVGGIYDMKVLPTGRVIVQKPYLSSIKGPESLIYHPMFIDKDGNRHVVKRTPTTNEIRDMLTAWYVNIGTRSNGIDIFKDGISIAVGSGQQERVGALENSIIKAYHKAMDREGIKYDPIDGTGIHEDTLNRLRAGIKEYQDAMDKAGIAYVPIEIKDNTFAMMARSELKQNPLSGAVVSSDAFFPFRDSIDTMAKHGIAAVIQPGGSIRDFEVIDAVNEHGMAMVYTLERCFGHF